ncbi:hypothetical protein DPMN_115723 [Dreissena polymorpha]|uniref:Uncharacterized protein n=1 Tax=Dreissena polymorpha TaxID=45954 RepID=A0A9D4KLQ4_DREPO|nr:hypothetical protein DPMN_115723 [Dreissena polymorpha]
MTSTRQKSSCIRVYPKSPDPSPDFILEGTRIPLDTSTTHLGVYRDTKCKENTKDKIELERRTAYSLMGAGFNGKNGLKQSVKARLWSYFVVPRMLYALEVLPFSQADLKAYEAFQLKTLKQVQHLADRTSNIAALSLLGILPIRAQLHKNTLYLHYSIIQTPGTVEYKVAERQLAMKLPTDLSFFSSIRRLLHTYNLPTAFQLFESPPSKEVWKL